MPISLSVVILRCHRDGEIVSASEKLVSLFEPHADIIVKGRRQVQYGHKLNLATGKSGLILDIVIENRQSGRCRAREMCTSPIALISFRRWDTVARTRLYARALD